MKRILFLVLALLLSIFSTKVKGQTQLITTIAGNGTSGYVGDGILAYTTEISTPYGVVADAVGNIYFSDMQNNRIRKIDPCGIITTIAGVAGAGSYSGDNTIRI